MKLVDLEDGSDRFLVEFNNDPNTRDYLVVLNHPVGEFSDGSKGNACQAYAFVDVSINQRRMADVKSAMGVNTDGYDLFHVVKMFMDAGDPLTCLPKDGSTPHFMALYALACSFLASDEEFRNQMILRFLTSVQKLQGETEAPKSESLDVKSESFDVKSESFDVKGGSQTPETTEEPT